MKEEHLFQRAVGDNQGGQQPSFIDTDAQAICRYAKHQNFCEKEQSGTNVEQGLRELTPGIWPPLQES